MRYIALRRPTLNQLFESSGHVGMGSAALVVAIDGEAWCVSRLQDLGHVHIETCMFRVCAGRNSETLHTTAMAAGALIVPH